MPVPPSDNYYTDNEDLRWHLNNTVDWNTLIPLYEREFTLPDGPADLAEAKESYVDIITMVGEFVAKEVAPRAEALDRTGNSLVDGEVVEPDEMKEIIGQLRDLGMFGLNLPREMGGLNVPFALYFAICEVIARADCGTMTTFGFFGGIGMSLLAYSAKEGSMEMKDGVITSCRFQKEIEETGTGEAWGAMVLTEPDAGSDLAAIRTRATKHEDGNWRLNGEKIFITSGHGQYGIVIARTDDPENEIGLDGLSLFLVRRWIEKDGEKIENVRVTKVEKKVGHNSSPTVSLLYEDSVGEQIGELGQGFKLMLILMNNARVAVGFEAIGVCHQALKMANHYAGQRRSMGKLLKDHELMADILQTMDTELRGMRALAFETVNHVEVSQRLETRLRYDAPSDPAIRKEFEKRYKRAKRKARRMTPLLKFIAAEKAVEFSRINMQVHGGMGYMSETGADRLLRDALVLPVYEGTSQIQALMVLKDHLGDVIRDPTGFIEKAVRLRVAAQTSRGLERALLQAKVKLHSATETILRRILAAKLKSEMSQGTFVERLAILSGDFMKSWDAKKDFSHGLVHAERICQMLVDVKIGQSLVHQAERHPERRIYAERYLKRMLPRVTCLELEIEGSVDLDDLTRAMAGEAAAV
ncbi:MAG: acyl-CoA dehydrogenase family protein [Planctomycetes bacterium]|nr:acyl-CoA dehydrogenase family protein [Planctomycetota bacterium]